MGHREADYIRANRSSGLVVINCVGKPKRAPMTRVHVSPITGHPQRRVSVLQQ